ncbi:MAG: VOC family protein [Ilumatobacteraceae bacterium]
MKVRALDHIVLNVTDVERSLAWYTGVLGLAPERVEEWRAGKVPFPSVRIDDGCIIDLLATERDGRNVDHFCLVADADDVRAISTAAGFEIVDGPGRRWGARGYATSVYVLDPDGNTVEFRSYESFATDDADPDASVE